MARYRRPIKLTISKKPKVIRNHDNQGSYGGNMSTFIIRTEHVRCSEVCLQTPRWQCRSVSQSPPIICKDPRIPIGNEQVIQHADWQPPWTASLPVANKQSYLINCTLSVSHEVAGRRENTHVIIPHYPCTLSKGLEEEICIWLSPSIWWPLSRCTNFDPHSAALQVRRKRKIEINVPEIHIGPQINIAHT